MSNAGPNTNPSIVKIPVSKIMENPDQPRHRFRPGSIQVMVESLLAIGQQTPIKVRPLTTEEKAGFQKPEWPGQEVPKKTIGELGFEYMLIGGHRRLAGAKLAGLETLDSIVLNIPPEDTHLASLMDNNLDEMDWWDWDLAIQAEHKAFPDMPQRQLAKRLGVSKTKVGNALILGKVINDWAKDTINLNLDKPPVHGDVFAPTRGKENEDEEDVAPSRGKTESDYQITEYVLLALAVLENPDLIDEAIGLIIDNEMSVDVVKKFIDWIKKGNEPQDFDPSAGSKGGKKGKDVNEEVWKEFAPNLKVKYKGGEDYEIHLAITGSQKTYDTAQAIQGVLQGGLAAKMAKFLYTNTQPNTRGKN